LCRRVGSLCRCPHPVWSFPKEDHPKLEGLTCAHQPQFACSPSACPRRRRSYSGVRACCAGTAHLSVPRRLPGSSASFPHHVDRLVGEAHRRVGQRQAENAFLRTRRPGDDARIRSKDNTMSRSIFRTNLGTRSSLDLGADIRVKNDDLRFGVRS
jgi:hypothetical protein